MTTNTQPEHVAADAAGVIVLNGTRYMRDAKSALVPVDMVKPVDALMDGMVRKMMTFATDLSAQIGRFRGHCFDDVGQLLALLEQEYNVRPGGTKGNMTFTTVDGCQRVQIAVADHISFGPELQMAKALVDECLVEWGADSRPELRAVVTRAFQVDREGKINRAELFMLMRVEIADPRWILAMQAIRDSIRIIGSKQYIRFYRRTRPTDPWTMVTLDLAQA